MRFLILPFIMMTMVCHGQDTTKHQSKFKSSREIETPHGNTKINRSVNLRAELGVHNVWFTSLGVSYLYNEISIDGLVSFVAYGAFEADWRNSPFYGYKAGGEFGGNLFGIAAEFKINDDFAGHTQFIFTPKFGIVLYGYINLMYGYNFFDKENNVFDISHNQISLSVNGLDLFKRRVVPSH
jgi:hypothetical protein